MLRIGRCSRPQEVHGFGGTVAVAFEQQRLCEPGLVVGSSPGQRQHAAIGIHRIGVAAQLGIGRRDDAPAPQVIRVLGKRGLDAGDGLVEIEVARGQFRALRKGLRRRIGRAEQAIDAEAQRRDCGKASQQRAMAESGATSGAAPFGAIAEHLAGKFAPRRFGLALAETTGRDIGLDTGKHQPKMAVGIGRYARGCVDHAGTGCVKQRSAGDGGDGNGDEPEQHEPRTLGGEGRQTGAIYKQTMAKNHTLTHS